MVIMLGRLSPTALNMIVVPILLNDSAGPHRVDSL